MYNKLQCRLHLCIYMTQNRHNKGLPPSYTVSPAPPGTIKRRAVSDTKPMFACVYICNSSSPPARPLSQNDMHPHCHQGQQSPHVRAHIIHVSAFIQLGTPLLSGPVLQFKLCTVDDGALCNVPYVLPTHTYRTTTLHACSALYLIRRCQPFHNNISPLNSRAAIASISLPHVKRFHSPCPPPPPPFRTSSSQHSLLCSFCSYKYPPHSTVECQCLPLQSIILPHLSCSHFHSFPTSPPTPLITGNTASMILSKTTSSSASASTISHSSPLNLRNTSPTRL